MAKRITKRQAKQVAKQLKKAPLWVSITAIVLAILIAGGYYLYTTFFNKKQYIPPVGELEFHFLTLGNGESGDSIYVRAGDVDVLIDAGSDYDSVNAIHSYLGDYISDGKLEYVIATHAHLDHIAAFAGDQYGNYKSIFDLYECNTIIDFDRTDSTSATYGRYVSKRDAEVAQGAVHYTALECYKETNGAKRVFTLSESVSMEILYNYYYDHKATEENDYSVCVQFSHGSRKFLFTGDLELAGEQKLIENNDLEQVELFKAGHHGSKTSSNECLLEVIKPKICVISCVAGNDQYSDDKNSQFPTQHLINRLYKYNIVNVYVTSIGDPEYTGGADFADFNGTVKVISEEDKDVYVSCSKNNTVLKDSDWFSENRKWQIVAL